MEILKKYKLFLIPSLVGFLFASFYIIVVPGEIRSDAAEYDDLANSILRGKYELNGASSMEREPGYPTFRAIIKTFNSNPHTILWVQAVLYALTIFFIGLTMNKLDPEKGRFAVWGATLAYSLAFYPSVHLSETLVAFLLATIGYNVIKGIENPSWIYFIQISLLSDFLLLTRYTYILIPIAAFSILLIYTKEKLKISIGLLIVFCLVTPWVTRNYKQFGEFNMAGRSGAVMYARAVRVNASWRSLADSYLSVLLGRGLLFSIYPSNQSIWLEQWGDWWRDEATVQKMWGTDTILIDKARRKAALEIITRDTNTFAKFLVWTGVDELRLLELPNPIIKAGGSPFEGTYGPLAKEGKLSNVQFLGLTIVHLAQLFWFIAIFVSVYLGFKRYGLKFIPGIFLICILLPHSIADNIPRYGAPLQPWLLSGIFMLILFPIYIKINAKFKYPKEP